MNRLVEIPLFIGVIISLSDDDLSDTTNGARSGGPTATRHSVAQCTLFWKAMLLKIHRPAAIVVFVFACVIMFLLCPICMAAKNDTDDSSNPSLIYQKYNFTQNLLKAMAIYPDSKLVLFLESQWILTTKLGLV
jgi:MFS-type transporter involved in bile tolerance (Atg22 family)